VHTPRVEEFRHQRDAVAIDDAQRHVVVDPKPQLLVEAADGGERGPGIGAQRIGDVRRPQRRAVVERRRTSVVQQRPAAHERVIRRMPRRIDIEEVAMRLAHTRIRGQRVDQLAQRARQQDVVGVDVGDVGRAAVTQDEIVAGTDAAVAVIAQQRQPRIVNRLDHPHRVVLGMIVDDDELEVDVLLRQDTLDRGADEPRSIVGRHRDGHLRARSTAAIPARDGL
jgi:hypothetical protein